MIASPVAYRYARSILDLARERGELEHVNADLAKVAATCAASRELRVLLASPVVKADAKAAILTKVFGGQVGDLVDRFIDILVRKGREALLPQVAQAYTNLYKTEQGIITAQVVSAAPLTEASLQQAKALVAASYPGKTIDIDAKVDPALIGGLVVRVGDEQFDGSVSRRLHDLRRKFAENPFIPEI